MEHPVLKSRKNIILYILVWTMFSLVQAFYVHYTDNLNLLVAFGDGLVFMLLFGAMSISIWYMMGSDDSKTSWYNIAVKYITIAVPFISAWMLFSFGLLNVIFVTNYHYLVFLHDSISWRIISGAFLLSIVSMYYLLARNFNNLRDKLKKEAKLNDLLKEAELNALRWQIKPHFLFNSLNSISSLTMSNPEKAHEMIIKLSEFMRYSLKQPGQQLTSLQDEMHHVSLYLEIEKTRFGERLIIQNNLAPACSNLQLPVMIMQPLIENAVKHGIYQSMGNIHITISAECESDWMKVTVGNDYDPDAVVKGTGLGLKNISDRMKLVYGRSDLMKIIDNGSFYKVELNFPQEYENKNINR
ncbi:MAG: histidine kinase [Bacteroidota bacterium]